MVRGELTSTEAGYELKGPTRKSSQKVRKSRSKLSQMQPYETQPLRLIKQRTTSSHNLSRHSNTDTLKSERESLERIHTFSLKETPEESSYELGSKRKRGISNSSRNSSVLSSRSCSQYMPDTVKVYHKCLSLASTSMEQLSKILQEFLPISKMSTQTRTEYFRDRMAEKRRMNISFQSFEELSSLQTERKYKISARTTLGLKQVEDWISTFNIGNIMHL